MALPQPSASPRMIPKVTPNRPAPTRARPPRSSELSAPRDSVSLRAASGITASPTGTFSQKIHCQAIALDDGAAHERAERDAEAADAAPDAERDAAPLGREGLADQRERERRDHRRAEPLQGAGGDERVERRRERGQRAREREDAHAEHEHALAAEAVAERGAGDAGARRRRACRRSRSTRATRSSRRGPRGSTGSATPTTRLSSAVMKSPAPASPRVHHAVLLGV